MSGFFRLFLRNSLGFVERLMNTQRVPSQNLHKKDFFTMIDLGQYLRPYIFFCVFQILIIFGTAKPYNFEQIGNIVVKYNYASPTSGEAYRHRQLTTNFELWVEIFCVPTCFHVRIPKPCLSVCPSVRPSVRTPRKELTLASSISVLH